MSDGESRNQGGTVEYFVSHPWSSSGDGLFLYPKKSQIVGLHSLHSFFPRFIVQLQSIYKHAVMETIL